MAGTAGISPHQQERRVPAASRGTWMGTQGLYFPEENEVSCLRFLQRQIRDANEHDERSW